MSTVTSWLIKPCNLSSITIHKTIADITAMRNTISDIVLWLGTITTKNERPEVRYFHYVVFTICTNQAVQKYELPHNESQIQNKTGIKSWIMLNKMEIIWTHLY